MRVDVTIDRKAARPQNAALHHRGGRL